MWFLILNSRGMELSKLREPGIKSRVRMTLVFALYLKRVDATVTIVGGGVLLGNNQDSVSLQMKLS